MPANSLNPTDPRALPKLAPIGRSGGASLAAIHLSRYFLDCSSRAQKRWGTKSLTEWEITVIGNFKLRGFYVEARFTIGAA